MPALAMTCADAVLERLLAKRTGRNQLAGSGQIGRTVSQGSASVLHRSAYRLRCRSTLAATA
ncbi:hypothetical protein CVO74_08125 [Xanthomonas prunicola]|uniref:Uncharacterized protein n=1 Tax=Xanthomonas prunicola TaxID=2053930 RepID=A0A2N3RI57_9XANT|nr:hypothetical protein XpruCFBP8353_15165 [Xanthomonas prunicola]PKV16448.1 hypothetical protein XpruCFBP8354_15150 [Xanthomonas prunicola]PKV23114.1 hypothetical protein CVO74_08125 [Xanthomonas prunicola]